MSKQLSAAECAAILKAGDFDQFIGGMESDEFECKAEPYRLMISAKSSNSLKTFRRSPMHAAE